MRISPSTYHTVPRTLGRRAAEPSCSGPAGDHEITPECLKTVIPARRFRAMTPALADRWPSRVLTEADVLALYQAGQLAALPGLRRRSYAGLQNGLCTAGLITRQDAPGRRSDAAAQGACARGDAAGGMGGS